MRWFADKLPTGVILLEIGSRNARVQALQDRWTQLRAAVALLLRIAPLR